MTYKEDQKLALALQRAAREEMIQKLLADILIDMNICEIEGWDKYEYIRRLKKRDRVF